MNIITYVKWIIHYYPSPQGVNDETKALQSQHKKESSWEPEQKRIKTNGHGNNEYLTVIYTFLNNAQWCVICARICREVRKLDLLVRLPYMDPRAQTCADFITARSNWSASEVIETSQRFFMQAGVRCRLCSIIHVQFCIEWVDRSVK